MTQPSAKGLKSSLLALSLVWVMVGMWSTPLISAAEKDKDKIPPAPGDYILDDGRALSESAAATLSDELRAFEKATGCTLRVATITYLNGRTVREYANSLTDAWNPSGHGLVFAYDRATDGHAAAPTQNMWETYPTPALVEAFREVATLMTDKAQPLDKRLPAATRVLMKRITEAEEQRLLHNQLLPGHDRVAAIAFLAVLVAGVLICGLIVSHLRKRDASNAIRYFFPQADVAMRFGAPYGGGVMAEARISRPHP